jgi:tetratricopeptide (TPR) repeat protein
VGDFHLSAEAMARLLSEAMTPEELAASDAHLRVCADCRTKLDELTATTPAVASILSPLQTPPAVLSTAPPGFELLGILGAGKTATVYRARQTNQGRIVALKMLSVGWPNDAEAQRRFQVEIEATASQNHPNIVQVIEVGTHQGRPFLVMEFCAGGSLADRLRDGPLPPRQAAVLIELLARTLHTVHENGLVHRDLKPANILFDGENRPKVADFGVVKRLDAAGTPTPMGSLLGTPPYLAPEQIDGTTPAGSHCDVYALGAILYECLIGRPPFRAGNVADILFDVLNRDPMPLRLADPRLPRALETICLKCLEKEPARRYGSALELAEDLYRFLNGQAVRARPVRLLRRTWRRMRRHPFSAALAAALLLTVTGGLGLCGSFWYQAVASQKETEISRREAEEYLRRLRRLLPDLVTAGRGPILPSEERSRIRRATLEEACDLYREQCRARPDDRELRGELAHVLTVLAEAAGSERRYVAAGAAVDEALAHWRRLRDDEPQEPRWRRGAAQALLQLATIGGFLGRSREVADAYREAVALYQALAEEHPGEDGPLQEAVIARRDFAAQLSGEGKMDESLSLLEENRRQLEKYREARADSVDAHLELMAILYNLGSLYQKRGDVAAAHRCWRAVRQQAAGLEKVRPQDPRVWYYPTDCALRLPRADPEALSPAQAILPLEQTMRILEIAYAMDAWGTYTWLAEVSRRLADCYLATERPADALRMERRAAEALPPRADGSAFLDLVRLEGKACLARRERQVGQIEASRRHAQETADGFEAFCRTHAIDAALLDAAVDFYPQLAPPLRHAEAVDQSRRVVECALQIVRQRTGTNPDATQLRHLSEVCVQMAKCRMHDDRDRVEADLREAVGAARRLVAIRPEYRYVLDDRLSRLTRWLAELGRRPQAAACLREFEPLWVQDADGLRGLARNFRNLADEVKNAREPLSKEEKAEREGYLADAARLEKEANALGR